MTKFVIKMSFMAGRLLAAFLFESGRQQCLFSLYAGFLTGSVAFMAGSMLVYWTEYSSTERNVFTGWLVGLAAILGVVIGRWMLEFAHCRVEMV